MLDLVGSECNGGMQQWAFNQDFAVRIVEIIDPVNVELHPFGYRPAVSKKFGPSADRSKVRVSIKCSDLVAQSTGQCDIVGIQTGNVLTSALSPPMF
jgi:hypothetical protein